jgi:hypothetical protein
MYKKVLLHWVQGLYSQHFIFFVTYKLAQKARAFLPGKPFQASVTKHSSYLCPFLSYEENELL